MGVTEGHRMEQTRMREQIAVVGLGYVGLPVALALSRVFPGTVGFDINPKRIDSLKRGIDGTGEFSPAELAASDLTLSSDPGSLCAATFYVVAVSTPIDRNHQPDLAAVRGASSLVGQSLRPGAVVVYESTVYPGVTEEICGPILAQASGLRQGIEFKLGYSPERINPGDKVRTLQRVIKIVSAEDPETLQRVAGVYEAIVEAGVYRAPSIKVAEAAKVIENTQRDLNIALMNELALIFDRLGISTHEVLEAAGTKWNFLPFKPGLVGGHCIGVDPYYLTAKADEVGYHPHVILAGRRINDGMGEFLAQRLVKLLVEAGAPVKGARVGILGLAFKENVPDTRNSRVPDIVAELRQFGIQPLLHDPLADPERAAVDYRIDLAPWDDFRDLDGLVLAVGHRAFLEKPLDALVGCIRQGGVLMDVKSLVDPKQLRPDLLYWAL